MFLGYHRKILHVNLTQHKITIEEPDDNFYRKYIGGSAMGMYYMLNEMSPGADPLGPDNVLTLMLSVLTGAPISGQSRLTANAKSPLVDGIGDSQSGGFFPAELKFAGYDGIVIKGKSKEPVYLWIKNGQTELRSANHIWGKTTAEVDEILKKELEEKKVEILQCGPAGEKLSCLAAIINMSNRANGRTGLGAVMGSKQLKAIAVRGTSKKFPIANPKRLNVFAKEGVNVFSDNTSMVNLQTYGTAGVTSRQHAEGGLPTYNFNAGQFAENESINGETMTDSILTNRDTCYACTVKCKRSVSTTFENEVVSENYGGPEYETLATFGSYCGVSNLNAIALANQICNQYGLDTIGTGATIAWAMECFNAKIISEKEVGFPIPFGDSHAMIKLTKLLAERKGFGDLLADGSKKAADKINKGHEFLITVKGSETPAHMPQVKRSLGLIYSVNPFGADHNSSEHDPAIENEFKHNVKRFETIGIHKQAKKYSLNKDKVHFALKSQHMNSFLDSANLCVFVWGPSWQLFSPNDCVQLVKTITNWNDFTADEMLLVGERRLNMLRAFNAREGLDRSNDTLPKKFFKALQGDGPSASTALDIEEIIQAQEWYYCMSGWNVDTGNPTPETLDRLGLEWVDI